ncbi:hypothetical protein EKK58_11990 [Candidatus Dependentiae bacterium]|nr:MAG: hypothetical protein EKK58_11990 [Candidatus Dependentiae bacterium]
MGNYANSIRSANATMEDIATLTEGVIGSSSNDVTSTAYTPTLSASGLMTYTSTTITYARYLIKGPEVTVYFRFSGTTGGTAGTDIRFTLPFTSGNFATNATQLGTLFISQNGSVDSGFCFVDNNSSTASCQTRTQAVWGLGANRLLFGVLTYLRA